MADTDNPLERAVELFVYAPIGLAMFAKDTVPTFMKMFVSRGQTEVTQRRKTAGTQADQYKTIGQIAVKFGGPEVKRQAEAAAGTVRRHAEDTLAGIVAATAPPRGNGASAGTKPPRTFAPEPTETTGGGETLVTAETRISPDPTDGTVELPISDYDLLSASQVIDRLDGLTAVELGAVQDYETAHRGRTTILGKINQLAS